MEKNPLFILYLTIFINSLGFGIIFPLLPIYAKSFQASETTIGILAASFAVAQLLFSSLWGRLSDKIGRKPVIVLSLLGLSVSFASFGLAKTLPALFISRFLQGFFAAAAMPTIKAYAADITAKEQRTAIMGRLGASLSLGFVLGPAFGGLLSQDGLAPYNHLGSYTGLALPFFAASAICFLNFISVLLQLPKTAAARNGAFINGVDVFNLKSAWRDLSKALLPYFLMVGLWSYGISNNQVAIPLFGVERLNLSSAGISWLFIVMGVTSIIIQGLFVEKLARKLNEEKLARAGLFIMALGLFLMAFSPTPLFLAMTMMVLAAGSSLCRPVLNSIISRLTPAGQGISLGTAMSFEATGRILGPLTGGFLFQHFQGFGPFWTAAFLIVVFLLFYRKTVKAV